MEFKRRTLMDMATMMCGNYDAGKSHFVYRSSSKLTQFFSECETEFVHDGSTRDWWVADALSKILAEPHKDGVTPPVTFCRVIRVLMDQEDSLNDDSERSAALKMLNGALGRQGFEAFFGADKLCYLKHVPTNSIVGVVANPHRPFSLAEQQRREKLSAYLDGCSEDDLIGHVLLPLFRQLGFHRISSAGHKDKALEYGKDVWMRLTLPTQHVLYFGLQAKKGKLDSSGVSKGSNANVAEIHHQALMMLGHEVFDPEIGQRFLVDHAFIVAGGEITKAARNWIGNMLDASKRSQIMFMDREDILNLFVVTNIPLPAMVAGSFEGLDDDIPF